MPSLFPLGVPPSFIPAVVSHWILRDPTLTGLVRESFGKGRVASACLILSSSNALGKPSLSPPQPPSPAGFGAPPL